jgi:hypothetical protein
MYPQSDPPPYDPKLLTTLFITMLLSQIIFLGLALWLIPNPHFGFNIYNPLFTLAPLLALALIVISQRTFASGIATLGKLEWREGLQKLTLLHALRWTLVEASSILLISCMVVTSNYFFLGFVLATIFYFATLKPRIYTFNF